MWSSSNLKWFQSSTLVCEKGPSGAQFFDRKQKENTKMLLKSNR